MTKEQLQWLENFCIRWNLNKNASEDLRGFIVGVYDDAFVFGQNAIWPE